MIDNKYRLAVLGLAVVIAWPAAGAEAGRAVPALNRPALQTAKASSSATLLTVARAGERVLAAGERGIIIYSDDGGGSWKQASTPTSVSITAMQFVDASTGWAVGHMGVVLNTTDGGRTWHKQLDGIAAAQLVLGQAKRSGDARALQVAEGLVADGADKPFFDVHFLNAHTGYVVGAFGLMFRTDDGGRSWTSWVDRIAAANPKGLHMYGMAELAGDLFIVGEQGQILRSDDQGEHFEALKSPYEGTWFGLIPAGQSLIVYGLRGNAFRSDDLGRSWQRVATDTGVSISAATRLPDGRLVLVSQAGEVLLGNAQADGFTHVPGGSGLPLAAVGAVPSGLVLASLSGVQTLRMPKP